MYTCHDGSKTAETIFNGFVSNVYGIPLSVFPLNCYSCKAVGAVITISLIFLNIVRQRSALVAEWTYPTGSIKVSIVISMTVCSTFVEIMVHDISTMLTILARKIPAGC